MTFARTFVAALASARPSASRRDERRSGGRPSLYDRDSEGFTLVELLVTVAITGIVLALLPLILEGVSNTTTASESISADSAQARLGLQNLAIQVGSASQNLCPDHAHDSGPGRRPARGP